MKKLLKAFWIVLGFLCMVLGTVGIVFPILPTVPFYMATLLCFAKSSQKLHDWFVSTNLYKKHPGQLRSEKSHDRRNKMQDHRNGHRCYGHRLSMHEKCAHRQGLHCRGVGLSFAVLHPAGQDHKACGTETGERRVIAFHWGIHVPLRSTNAKLSLWQFHFIIHFYKSILFIQWSSHLSCF